MHLEVSLRPDRRRSPATFLSGTLHEELPGCESALELCRGDYVKITAGWAAVAL